MNILTSQLSARHPGVDLTPRSCRFLLRGERQDQRRRPVCLRGAGGEDPADAGPVGEQPPESRCSARRAAGAELQHLQRILLPHLTPDSHSSTGLRLKGKPNQTNCDFLLLNERRRSAPSGQPKDVHTACLSFHFDFCMVFYLIYQ